MSAKKPLDSHRAGTREGNGLRRQIQTGKIKALMLTGLSNFDFPSPNPLIASISTNIHWNNCPLIPKLRTNSIQYRNSFSHSTPQAFWQRYLKWPNSVVLSPAPLSQYTFLLASYTNKCQWKQRKEWMTFSSHMLGYEHSNRVATNHTVSCTHQMNYAHERTCIRVCKFVHILFITIVNNSVHNHVMKGSLFM